MKVRIYKAPDGKGKLVKAQNGMAFNIDKEIKKKIAEGKDPEIIIYEMAEFGLSRSEARDKVYKLYDLLGDDDYDEDEVVAPYDKPVEEEVAEVVEEEEPDNAAIYDYYGGDNQGLAVVNDGADEDDDDDNVARYGGQYAEGGQFAPGSIIPKPKKPYYIGIDAEPYDNAYKFGGLTKGAYVKQRIKELRKAAQGEQVQNSETNISPIGTIDSPAGISTPGKNLASIIKQTGNEAVMKQQAENEYQQYQNSTMGQDFNGKFLFGGRNRKIRRANRAMFGTPIAMPGVDVNYEFGPLGGLRKAEANWDLDAIGDLAKLLPGAMNMMPGMFPGMMSYKKVSYPAQVRKKTINTINNAALDDVAKQNPNSTAAQNNRSDKKNEISCPPGSVYDPSLGHCVDQEGNMVRSIVDLPDPEELLGNPFENLNARMLNGKKTMKATGPSSSASSNASAMITQAPSGGGAPLQVDIARSSSMSPVLNAQGQQLTSDASNMMYGQQGLPPVSPSAPVASEWKGVYNPETDSYIDDSSMLYEFMTNNPDIVNDPTMEKQYNEMGYSSEDWNKAKSKYLSQKQQIGGFVDAANMDPNTLAKFIYGGNDYAYGGDVLPQAYDGFAGNFQKQMLATKNRINQMGSKNPADYNPFKGNAFGKATTGVQPSGTVGNRFQPTNEPNPVASTTQNQQGAGAPKQTTTTTTGQPQMDANTMAQFQKYMQMMQGQQGNPFMGNAFGNQQFWTGRPQRLGFGLTRDFNYGNSFSPVNWQVPQGTKHLRLETYKDRGKWYNPFDTKRITDYYADPNDEEASDDLINKQGSGKNIKTASGWGNEETDTAKERRQAKAHDELIASGAQMTDNIEEPPTSMKTLSTTPNLPDQLESGVPGRMQPLPASEVSLQGEQSTELQMPKNQGETELQNNPFQGNAFEGNQFGTAAGVTPSENMRFTQGPNNFSPSAESTNPFTGNAFGTANTGITGNRQLATPGATSNSSNINTNVAANEGEQETDQIGASQNNLNPDLYGSGSYGFGEDMEGAPSIGGMSPWSLSNGFGANNEPQNVGSQMTESGIPYDQDLPFQPTDINDPSAGFGYGISPNRPGANVNKRAAGNNTRSVNSSSVYNQKQNPIIKNKTVNNGRTLNMSTKGVKEIAGRVQNSKDLGNKELVAAGNVYKMWESMSPADKKNAGGFNKWANANGYGKLVNRQYGGGMDYNSYIPEYMAYGGYIPYAKSGITAGKPEFEDPNLIGRTVENSAYTFTPGQFATDLFSGNLSLTGLTKNWAKAFDEEKNVLNPQRKMLMSSDAATANTGQSGFGSAERKGSDLMASGNETQYGSTPGKQGYEGGLYGKKGGSINTQYAKGKVYSLTMEQIKAIEAAGGKIEYIK